MYVCVQGKINKGALDNHTYRLYHGNVENSDRILKITDKIILLFESCVELSVII